MARNGVYDEQEWVAIARRAHFSCKQLCITLSVSQRQLERYTKQLFGCPPRSWLRAERIKLAGVMLVEKSSAKAACFELYFRQYSHFSREFKRHYGLSPSDFLAEKRQKGESRNEHGRQVQLDFGFMSRLDNTMSRLDK